MRRADTDVGGQAHGGRALRVVKVGGRELSDPAALERFASWVEGCLLRGHALVLVHGGGDEVTALARRLDLPTVKVEGQRVTTPEVLPLVEGVLAGPVNLRVVGALTRRGLPAVGLTGVSASCVVARPAQGGALGLVGEPEQVDARLLRTLLEAHWLPVVAPLASDGKGGVLNVNADLFAQSVASALGAELLLLTDVPGVLDPGGRPYPTLVPTQIGSLVEEGTISGGMVPKAEAAVRALGGGLPGVWIGRLRERVASDPFSPPDPGPDLPGPGTWVLPEGDPREGCSPAVPPTRPLSGAGPARAPRGHAPAIAPSPPADGPTPAPVGGPHPLLPLSSAGGPSAA